MRSCRDAKSLTFIKMEVYRISNAVFRRFAAAEAASGRTPEHSDQLYSLLLQQLHASMCNSNEQAVYRLTTPPP